MREDEFNPEELPDELADQPLTDEPLEGDIVMPSGPTPYTDDTPPTTEDGTILPEPIPDDTEPAVVPSQVSAVIRTVTPMLVGWIVAGLVWALTPLGVVIPDTFAGWLETAVPVVLGALYYLLAKALEKRWPGVPWLGSTRKPLYTRPTDGPAAFAIAPLARTGYVWYKGGRFSPAFRDALVELDRLTPDVPLVVTQGGYNGSAVAASAGTHGGDSVDFSVRGLTREQVAKAIEAGRKVGIFLSFRTTDRGKWGVRPQGFSSYHLHGVPNGWGNPSAGARRQIAYTDSRGVKRGYRNGRDGLASNGPDGGPGHTGAYRFRTWPGYKSAAAAPSHGTVKPSTPSASKPSTPSTAKPFPRAITPKPWPIVAVDGKLGPETLKRLQAQLSVAPTGKLDHYTVRALKMWLGNKDDGKGVLSPFNVQQLQYRVGFRGRAQDGVWGPATTKALQRYLNANR